MTVKIEIPNFTPRIIKAGIKRQDTPPICKEDAEKGWGYPDSRAYPAFGSGVGARQIIQIYFRGGSCESLLAVHVPEGADHRFLPLQFPEPAPLDTAPVTVPL